MRVLAHSHMFEIFCTEGNFGVCKLSELTTKHINFGDIAKPLGMWTIIMLFNIKQGILAEEILENLW